MYIYFVNAALLHIHEDVNVTQWLDLVRLSFRFEIQN